MKKINLFSIIVVALAALFMLPVVYAVTLVSPADNAVVSDEIVLNATGTNLLNCSFYAKSLSTANNTWTLLGTFYNDTAADTSINGTFNTTGLEDSNDYSFNATCTNTSNDIESDRNTGITIDNTVPDAPTSLSPTSDSVDSDGDVTFSATVTGSKTTGCTLYFVGNNPGSSSYTMTHSGDTCTKQLTSIPEQTYTWYVVASDGSNTTSSSTSRVIVDIQKSAGKAVLLEKLAEEGKLKRTGAKTFTVASGIESFVNQRVIGIPMWLIIVIGIVVVIVLIKSKKA